MTRLIKYRKKLLFALLSAALYALAVWQCVYAQWPDLMRNGDLPTDALAIHYMDRLSKSNAFLDGIMRWLLIFGFLALFLVLCYYWLARFSPNEKKGKRWAAQYRMFAVSTYFGLVNLFWLLAFRLNDQANVGPISRWVHLLLAAFAAVVALIEAVLCCVSLARNPKQKLPENYKSREAFAFQSHLGCYFHIIVAYILPLLVLGGLITCVLLSFFNPQPHQHAFLKRLSFESPFVLRTYYDYFVAAMPLIGLILLWLNLKYNAPHRFGEPITYKGKLSETAYTLHG